MTIGTVRCGWTMKAHSKLKNSNLDLGFAHHLRVVYKKNVISVPGFFHKMKGSSNTQRASFPPRRAQANSTMVPPSPTAPAGVEQNRGERLMDQLMGLVTASQNNSPTVLAQNNDEVESLVSQLENVDCELKNIELPPEETRSANTPAINLILNSPKKVVKSIIGLKDPLHNNTFLSKLVEIDVGLSNLKAGPSTINDPLSADISINEHVITEEANEAARVSHVQGAVTHASTRAAKTETQNTQPPRQQGSWKRLNKADAPSKTDKITNTVESVLSTKRVYEELSHSNGLPSKKCAVSVEINSSTLAEADVQPRPTQ